MRSPRFPQEGGRLRSDLPTASRWGPGGELGFGPPFLLRGLPCQYLSSNWVNWVWIRGGNANFSVQIPLTPVSVLVEGASWTRGKGAGPQGLPETPAEGAVRPPPTPCGPRSAGFCRRPSPDLESSACRRPSLPRSPSRSACPRPRGSLSTPETHPVPIARFQEEACARGNGAGPGRGAVVLRRGFWDSGASGHGTPTGHATLRSGRCWGPPMGRGFLCSRRTCPPPQQGVSRWVPASGCTTHLFSGNLAHPPAPGDVL